MKRLLLFALATFTVCSAAAQMNQPIPADPELRTGKLENGMTYYVRHNEKPKGQADFYIIHNVGAIQEDDSQQGLAHFLEHMAFNGTKNLPGKQMIEYLETIGVKFGANLNAGTSWDQTVYNISDVPTSREGIIDSALLILHDWSHFITLAPEEIDSERGVIMEELRTRDGASWRSSMKLLQALGKGTRYEHRNLIGYLDGLKSFEHQALADFYHKWYRPDYQAVIVVGDIDAEAVEAKIKKLMSDIPAPAADAAQKEKIVVPDNEEPIVSIYTDPEMQGTKVQLFIKRPAFPSALANTVSWEAANVIESYITVMENARLQEIAMQPDAPFLGAGMGSGDVIGVIPTLNATVFIAMTQEGKLNRGFETLYTEMERMRRYGFTQGEFERAQENLMRQVERTYANRNDRQNSSFVQTYLNNFQKNTPIPDAETEWQLDSMLVKMINVEMVNAFAQQTVTPTNQVIIVTAPEKEGLAAPTAEELLAIREKVAAADVKPYEDNVVKEPLIPEGTQLKGSKVKKTVEDPRLGTTEWTLANGVKVVVKKTDFKADEVLMSAVAKGGLSRLSDEEFYMGEMMPAINSMSGVGKFSATELKKQLSGKTAGVQPAVGNYSSTMNGSASPKDVETMLQLLYLHFSQPRFDRNDYDNLITMAPFATRQRPVEPRLPDAGEDAGDHLRKQPPPPDGIERDYRRFRFRETPRHLRQTLPRCQQFRLHVRREHRPRSAETPGREVHRLASHDQEADDLAGRQGRAGQGCDHRRFPRGDAAAQSLGMLLLLGRNALHVPRQALPDVPDPGAQLPLPGVDPRGEGRNLRRTGRRFDGLHPQGELRHDHFVRHQRADGRRTL